MKRTLHPLLAVCSISCSVLKMSKSCYYQTGDLIWIDHGKTIQFYEARYDHNHSLYFHPLDGRQLWLKVMRAKLKHKWLQLWDYFRSLR